MADDDSSAATPESSTTAQLLNQIRISNALQARVNQLEDEADDSNRLLARVNHLQAQLDDSNLWNQMITDRINEHQENARQEIEALSEQLDAFRIQNDGMEKEIASLQDANQSQEQQIAELQASLAGEREENDRSRQEIVTLENTNGILQARYDGLEAQANRRIEKSRQEIEALNDNVANIGEQLSSLQIQHEGLQQEVESFEIEKEQAIASLQGANRIQEQQLAELRASLAGEREKNEASRQKMTELEQVNGNILAEKDALETQSKQEREMSLRNVASLEQRVDTLQTQNEGLRKEVDSVKAAEIEKEQAIASLQDANQSQEQQIAELQASLAGEREENDRSRQEIVTLENVNDNLRVEKETLAAQSKRENEALRQEIAELKHDNSNLRTRCNKVQSDKETLAANVMSAREINSRLLSEKEQMFEQQMVAEKNIDELLVERRKLTLLNYELTLLNEELNMQVAQLKTEWLEELDELTNHTKRNELVSLEDSDGAIDGVSEGAGADGLVLPHAQSRSVTPAHSQSKRGQSMTATTESSSAESKSPERKRSKMSHETTRAEPPSSAMPDADSDESMTNVDDQAVKFGTAVDESTSLVTTQDSQTTLTLSEATETNSIVVSGRASHTRLNEEFTPFLLEMYGDREYAVVNLMTYPAPRMTKDSTLFVRLCFLFSRTYLKKFFGYLTTNTEQNAGNGIVLKKPYGLRAALDFLGISVENFAKILIKFNFSHHPDNPEILRRDTNLRQDFKLLHPDMHEGANPLLVQLRNVPPSHNSLPRSRRQPEDADAFDIRTHVKNLIAEEDKYRKYEVAIRICERLRSFRDEERILEQLNLLTRHSTSVLSLMLHIAGVVTSARKVDDANEKLASRLSEGDDFVRQEDVLVSGNRICLNRGQQVYQDAIEANADAFSRAQQKRDGKYAALQQVRENVISRVNGRFMYDKDGALQEIPEKELRTKINSALHRSAN